MKSIMKSIMKLIMKPIRWFLGKIILGLDALFTPQGLIRDQTSQKKIELEIAEWRLYQLLSCPFCVKVRREMKRLSITIPTKEVATDPAAHAELMAGGKIDQVPCLRIPKSDGTVEWMYESSAIVSFLQNRFQN